MNCQHQPIPHRDSIDKSSVLPLCTNKCFGQTRYVYTSETGSTNDDALKLAADGAPHGTLVVANKQTRARGRNNRSWEAPPNGGIYVSLILRPNRPLQDATLLGIVTAVAAVQAIKHTARTKAQIKWPNDILLHQRKIAGILTETDIQPDGTYAVIIGLGINVNTPYTALPSRVIFPASSMQHELGKATSRTLLLAAWLESMEQHYQLWQDGNTTEIIAAWHKHAYGIGKTISIQQGDQNTTGILQGMAEDGSLILKGNTGEIIRIISGDVASTSFL